MILKKFESTEFKLIVHDNGFELFAMRENPTHCGDYDYDNPFEHWEDVTEEE